MEDFTSLLGLSCSCLNEVMVVSLLNGTYVLLPLPWATHLECRTALYLLHPAITLQGNHYLNTLLPYFLELKAVTLSSL